MSPLRAWCCYWAALAMIFLGLLCLLAYAALAQDCEVGTFGCNHHENHDAYKGWTNRQGGSCCNGKDCRPVRAKQDLDGNWLIYIPELKTWLQVPPQALLPPDKLKDGRSHACTSLPGNPMMPVPVIYCFSPTGSKS